MKQKNEEHEQDWSSVIKEKEDFSHFQKSEVYTVKEKERRVREELQELIKERQQVREIEKRMERRMELDALDYQTKSVEERDKQLRR